MRKFINDIKYLLQKYEPIVFVLFAFLNLSPFFVRQFYPFMDAPAHVYNSKVINELLFYHNSFLKEYFAFNPVVVPNWMSHLMMTPFHSYFTPDVAEKSFLISYYFAFPIALRYCIQSINGNKYISYFGFPLAYNTLICFSFFNFSIGLIFLMLSIGYFYRHIAYGPSKIKHYLFLLVLLLATYLSHLIVLMAALLVIFLMYINALWLNKGDFLKSLFASKTWLIIAVSLPSVIFLALYLKAFHSPNATFDYLPKGELLEYLLNGQLFIAFGKMESFAAGTLALLFIMLCSIGFYSVCLNSTGKWRQSKNSFLGLSILILMVAYMFLPDADGVGGFVSMRFCIIIFIIAALFISTVAFKKELVGAVLLIILACQYFRIEYFKECIKNGNEVVSKIQEQAMYIEPNSFLLSFKKDDSWTTGHYNNYLALDRAVVLLQNYECKTGYFPLVWRNFVKTSKLRDDLLGFRNLDLIKSEIKNHAVYYWVLGDVNKADPLNPDLKANLEKHCILLNSNNFASLYKLK